MSLSVCLIGLPVAANDDAPPSRIAFGSCANQNLPQPIWDRIVAAEPDLFIFAGDNIYADTIHRKVMMRKYGRLALEPGFAALRDRCPILATWDDHDYGRNDAGAEYPAKEMSKACFMEFFDIPSDAPMRKRPGIYAAHLFGPPGQRVQIVLLDTRSFRGPLLRLDPRPKDSGPYRPNEDPDVTVLGEAQWAWLEQQLEVPAEVRLLVSSIQVVAEEHAWEKWMNFPHERERLINLLHRTAASGVIVLSGDRHHAELSRLDKQAPYPLFDLTSSALNQKRPGGHEPNRHRVGPLVFEHNFGVVDLDWNHKPSPLVTLQIRTRDGETPVDESIPLARLRAASAAPAVRP